MELNPFTLCPDCVSDRSKLKGVLLDVFFSEKIKCNTIIIAFDEGIVDAITNANIINNQFLYKFSHVLINDYGISNSIADWTVNYWVEKYGKEILGKTIDIDKETKDLNIQTPTPINEPKVAFNSHSISIKDLSDNEKLPKSLIYRHVDEEIRLGIADLKCSVKKDYDYEHYLSLKITGEYSGKSTEYLIIMFMVFNAHNEMIAATFDELIDNEFKGTKSFSNSCEVPIDEYISKIEIKIIKDPAFV